MSRNTVFSEERIYILLSRMNSNLARFYLSSFVWQQQFFLLFCSLFLCLTSHGSLSQQNDNNATTDRDKSGEILPTTPRCEKLQQPFGSF